MQLEIITPEKEIFKGGVEAVQFPGLDGSFQVLKGHAPIISALKEGVVKIDLTDAFDHEEKGNKSIMKDQSNAKVIRVNIHGGVMELQNDKIIVLAE